MKFLALTIGSILTCFCLLLAIRWVGLSAQYIPYDHPLMKRTQPWQVYMGGQGTAKNTLAAFREFDAKMSSEAERAAWLGLDVALTSAGDLIVAESANPTIKIEEALNEVKNHPVALIVNVNEKNIDLRLQELFNKTKSIERVLIISEYDNVVQSLKKLIPQGLYSTGAGDKVRALMLDGIGLSSIANVRGDVFVVSSTDLTDSFAKEMKRRFIPILVMPNAGKKTHNLNLAIEGSYGIIHKDN